MYNGGGCGDPHTESEEVSDHTTGSENVGSGEVIQDETEDLNNGHANGHEGEIAGCNGRNGENLIYSVFLGRLFGESLDSEGLGFFGQTTKQCFIDTN